MPRRLTVVTVWQRETGCNPDGRKIESVGVDRATAMNFTAWETRPGTVTVPGGGRMVREVPPGTLNSVLKQAQLKQG